MFPMPQLSNWRLAGMSALWLAFNAQWLTLAPVAVPQAVANMSDQYRELWSGLIVAAGAAVAVVVPPVAGALSDRTRNRRGRRRPYLVSGVLAASLTLLMLAWALSVSVIAVGAVYLILQFCWNWAAGPYAGLIPDVVGKKQRAQASGWLNVMTISGTVIGLIAANLFYRRSDPWPMTAVWIGLSVICLIVTLRSVVEPVPKDVPPWLGLRRFVRSFYLPFANNRAFYWVLITRLFNNFGIWSVFTFLVLYLQFVVGMSEVQANRMMTALLAVGAVLGVAGSLAAPMLTRRYGPVGVVRRVSWVMAWTVVCYVIIAAAPHVWLVVPVVVVYGLAFGVFGAADWALALWVLPDGREAGKDFGIWHICLVLPQALGPITTGVLITLIRSIASGRVAYGVAFAIAGGWFIAGALFVTRIRLDDDSSASGDTGSIGLI